MSEPLHEPLCEPLHEREAQRQRLLLAALWADPVRPARSPADDQANAQADAQAHAQGAAQATLAEWLQGSPQRQQRGLLAHTAHAAVLAPQALAQAYPTVAAMVGDKAWALIARRHWLEYPPERGDLACWGEHLAAALAVDAQLADWPCLADVARLDWAVHRCDRAADGPEVAQGLHLLAEVDPAGLYLQLAPGGVLLRSAWPVITLRAATAAEAPADALQRAGAALSARQAETAWVWRPIGQWRTRVHALAAGDAAFQAAVLRGAALAQAIDQALAVDAAWPFEAWLVQALQGGWLAAVQASGLDEGAAAPSPLRCQPGAPG